MNLEQKFFFNLFSFLLVENIKDRNGILRSQIERSIEILPMRMDSVKMYFNDISFIVVGYGWSLFDKRRRLKYTTDVYVDSPYNCKVLYDFEPVAGLTCAYTFGEGIVFQPDIGGPILLSKNRNVVELIDGVKVPKEYVDYYQVGVIVDGPTKFDQQRVFEITILDDYKDYLAEKLHRPKLMATNTTSLSTTESSYVSATSGSKTTASKTTGPKTTGPKTTGSQTTESSTTESATSGSKATASKTTVSDTTASATNGSATTESAATESATTESASTETATTESAATGSATNESSSTETATMESAATGSTTTESSSTETTTTESAATGSAPT